MSIEIAPTMGALWPSIITSVFVLHSLGKPSPYPQAITAIFEFLVAFHVEP